MTFNAVCIFASLAPSRATSSVSDEGGNELADGNAFMSALVGASLRESPYAAAPDKRSEENSATKDAEQMGDPAGPSSALGAQLFAFVEASGWRGIVDDAAINAAGGKMRLTVLSEESDRGGTSDPAVHEDAEGSTVEKPQMRVSIETHLPFPGTQDALALDRDSRASNDGRTGRILGTDRAVQRAPVKILRFEVEPECLGPVLVKMRSAAARVDIEISVLSGSALSVLREAREKLASAIGATGFAVEAVDIRLRNDPLATAPNIGEAGGGAAGESAPQSGERSFSDGERARRRHPPPEGAPHSLPSGEPHRLGELRGVYL